MTIFNPGSGPVDGGSADEATANIHAFIDDLIERGHAASLKSWPARGVDEGRWRFAITVDGDDHGVEMPGLPLAQVRYMNAEGQDIWDFPRLYVDGSSWVWFYALNVIGDPT